jgi:hypothetical protein
MYLWVNICDLDAMGTIPGIGSPLSLMVQQSLGDKLLNGSARHPSKLDDMFVLIESTPERCKALQSAIEVLGQRKLHRKARTRITRDLPDPKTWRYS